MEKKKRREEMVVRVRKDFRGDGASLILLKVVKRKYEIIAPNLASLIGEKVWIAPQ